MPDNQILTVDDRFAIQKLLGEYVFGADTKDWDRVAAVYTPDAVLSVSFADYIPEGAQFTGEMSGSRAIVEAMSIQFANYDRTQHFLGATLLEPTADGAHAQTQLIAHHHRGAAFYHTGATYEDELTRTPDGWRITRRRLRISWTTGDPSVSIA